MKTTIALFLYAAAIFSIYAGFSIPGAEGLSHHVTPQTDAEITAALMIIIGSACKLLGHLVLFSTTRARAY